MKKIGKASAESQVTNNEPQEKAEIEFQWSFHSCPSSLGRTGFPSQKARLSNMKKGDAEAVKGSARVRPLQLSRHKCSLGHQSSEMRLQGHCRDKPQRSKMQTAETTHLYSSSTDTNTCSFHFCFNTFLGETSNVLSRTVVPFQLKYSRS